MDTVVVPFAPEHLGAISVFSDRYWTRPRTESFYRWRYLESQPFSRMFIALRGDECLGMLFALRKEYILCGRRVPCLELFDWHALPGQRGSGVGVRVMRAMMRQPERLITVGGTADVLSALPAFGWQRIGAARVFELPVSRHALATKLSGWTGLPAAVLSVPLAAVSGAWFRPRRRAVPSGGRVLLASTVGGEVDELYDGETGYALLQAPRLDVFAWMTARYPLNSSVSVLQFVVAGSVRGWAATRIYEARDGRHGDILEMFAPQPTVGLYTWMISEAASLMMAARPMTIRARASCPLLRAALRANRFREDTADIPIHTWPKDLPEALGPIHITLNHTDEPLRPYSLPTEGTDPFSD